MLPDNVLSTPAVPGTFLEPRNQPKEPLIDWCRGGVGLQDSSLGLNVYDWRARYVDGDILIGVPGHVPETVLVSVADVTELQFTFDQNMQPFVTYMVSGETMYYRWYDATVPGFVTDTVADAWSPRCDIDDRRQNPGILAGLSDIILAYLKDQTLYCRAQRDRYAVEYELGGPYPGILGIGQIGMADTFRFQFELLFPQPQRMDIRSINFRVHLETERGFGEENA